MRVEPDVRDVHKRARGRRPDHAWGELARGRARALALERRLGEREGVRGGWRIAMRSRRIGEGDWLRGSLLRSGVLGRGGVRLGGARRCVRGEVRGGTRGADIRETTRAHRRSGYGL